MESKSWLPLLIMAGFDAVQQEENIYELNIHNREDIKYLQHLITTANISFLECRSKCGPLISNRYGDSYLFSYFIKITEPPIQIDLWRKIIIDTSRGGYESGTDQDMLPLMCVEPHVRAIFSQFRRFGLHMVESCEGHDKGRRIPYNYPHFKFYYLTHALLAQELICNSGFKGELLDPKFLRIDENKVNLMALGVKLSELNNIDDYYPQTSLENGERLIKLLSIPGTSGNEGLVADKVLEMLGQITGTNSVFSDGNIRGELRKSTEKAILLSAHMDVYDEFSPNSSIVKQGNCLFRHGSILGADDRAGVALILNVLQYFSKIEDGYSIKYLFTTSEEYPPHGVENVDPAFFQNVEFALSLDRKGCSDIVYKSPVIDYGSPEFAKKISDISVNLFGHDGAYIPCEGGTSDLRIWSQLDIESVNLSIGYFGEHTQDESLDLNCWKKSYVLVLGILESEFKLFSSYQSHKYLSGLKP